LIICGVNLLIQPNLDKIELSAAGTLHGIDQIGTRHLTGDRLNFDHSFSAQFAQQFTAFAASDFGAHRPS
jgi:hypothetical protein